MSKSQRVGAWHMLYGISLFLYLVNVSILIYLQYEYYVSPSFIESMMLALPSIYTSQISNVLQEGYIGIMGTISVMLILIMIYIVINTLQGQARQVGGLIRIALLILLLVQVVLGNTGLLLVLITGLVSIALMR
ncbi:hypothetical protein [Vulcanisaeta sp. JCM 14467]|uniref:hypothetical protein n=1 Tax=Vulcanisaeta sp. JCM 14467 TaxID=1295370 RepID=UPI0006D1E9C7|nr:hypothetical protein [Vulcanisaeta sp. JCM 14467]